MIIHSDVFTYRHFEDAAAWAGVKIESIERKGSKSRHASFKFYLSGSSPYAPGFGRSFGEGVKAASWDEWGIFFARLFMLDPQAHCGKRGYQNEDDFHWVTGGRFRTLHPRNQHKRHKWQPLGMVDSTDKHCMAICECGAENHWRI
jgi:hypothetical protein